MASLNNFIKQNAPNNHIGWCIIIQHMHIVLKGGHPPPSYHTSDRKQQTDFLKCLSVSVISHPLLHRSASHIIPVSPQDREVVRTTSVILIPSSQEKTPPQDSSCCSHPPIRAEQEGKRWHHRQIRASCSRSLFGVTARRLIMCRLG